MLIDSPWIKIPRKPYLERSPIVRVLSTAVRVTTVPQIARAFYGGGRAAERYALRRVVEMEAAGLLMLHVVRAHPELGLERPVWSWKPGEPDPPFGILSYEVRSRWSLALRPVTVITASARSGRYHGGRGGRLAHPHQVTHDLHVSAIYFRLLSESPAEAMGWVPESRLIARGRGRKIPDAEIQDSAGRTIRVIEFAGSYSPERLRLVHADCVQRQLPYELW